MSETIRVTVAVDTDELRTWADHHADRGHHGVAHVLYKAAIDGESLSEQAIREARSKATARAESAEAAHEALRKGIEALADQWAGTPDDRRYDGDRARALRALLAGGAS